MNYGYFDNQNKEYVITRPDTPTPWMNYLGNGGFSGMISNNAGGLLFDGDPGNRRLTRYKYNNLPMDRPGRYLYIRDMDTGEYWSAAWQPVMKPYEAYECRHGLGYTTIRTQTNGIETEITYYIPQGKKYEIWNGRIRNLSGRPRHLKLFSYMEFSYFNASVDVTAEWARYEMLCDCQDGIIICDSAVEVCPTGMMYGVMGTSLPVEGYDCYRDRFIGLYRSESNPLAVELGQSGNTHVGADQICGSLSSSVMLDTDAQVDFRYTVGIVDHRSKAAEMVREATDADLAAAALARIRSSWKTHLQYCQVKTPDEDMNTMLNIWHAYQCKMTFDWSRFISYYERGIVRGWGFRDSMQDVLGVMHALAPEARERIKTLLSIQASNGNARTVYYPATGQSIGGGRSDDHIWSIFSVCTYLRETGDYGFLKENVAWVDGGEGTVEEHLIRGLEFTRQNLGDHGIPNFLNSDWNDSICLINKDRKAESAFVFFQAAHAAYELVQLYTHLKDAQRLAWAQEYYEWCRQTYLVLWDGKWFLRAYLSTGEKFGTDEDEENKIFLNPQSWAVLSRLPSAQQSNSAMDEVFSRLFCKFGLISHAPASSKYFPEKKSFMAFPRGIKENGGVFCHANTWAVIAETLLGRDNEAFEIYRSSIPARRNDLAEQTLIEPYVYGSAQLGPDHERFGAGSNSWLTGTASWMYFAATQHILGFRPDYDGIVIDPHIPDAWDGFTMERVYRGTLCHLQVSKTAGTPIQVEQILLNGQPLERGFVSACALQGMAEAQIQVICR